LGIVRRTVAPPRVATNRTLIQALRRGSGPLTRTQRVGFFIVGSVCLIGGFAFILSSRSISTEMHEITSGVLGAVLTIVFLGGVLVVGCAAIILGLRIIRHVLWKAT